MNMDKRELLDQTFRTFVEVCFSSRNMDQLSEIVVEDVVGIGSAIDEKIFGLKELIALLNRQKEQSSGLEMRWELHTLDTHISDDESTAIYACEAKLFVNVDSSPLEIDLRLSTVLEYRENKWQVVHWHGSKPEAVESQLDTWGIENWKQKAAELEKQVAERTADLLVKNHELAIEAALERVRAVAMGMKKPEDLLDVCRIIAAQLQQFGVEHIRNVQLAIINESIGQYICYQYFPNYNETIIEDTQYHKSPVEAEMVRQMLACCDGHFIGCLAGEELKAFRLHRKRERQFPDSLMDEASEISYAFLSIGEGGLGLSLYGSMDEGVLNLFKRFHQVFNLTYQRFRDLQKAEAQAREAQVEAALERVRSHSMAMQHSDELNDLIGILYRELTRLEVSLDRCFIMTFDASGGDSTWWMASGDEIPYKTGLKVPCQNHAPHMAYLAGWREQKERWQYVLEGKEKKDWDDFLFGSTELERLPDKVKEGMKGLGKAFLSASFRSFGCLTTGSFTPLHNEAFDLLVRFTHVFDQSYTRFLDLQKAEAQAREAQIETAMERIRARAMAMHSSAELVEVAQVLREQMGLLNQPDLETSAVLIYHDDLASWDSWYAFRPTQDINGAIRNGIATFNKDDCGFTREIARRFQLQEKDYTLALSGADREEWIVVLMKAAPEIAENAVANETVNFDTTYFHFSDFSGGSLLTVTYYPPSEEIKSLQRRAASVFDLAYRRFLDLKKAEAQAREAEIQLALERVRARAMAMQKSDELAEAATILFQQVKGLGIETYTSGFTIWENDDKDLVSWMCNANGSVNPPFRMPALEYGWHRQQFESWKRGDEFIMHDFVGQEMQEHFAYLRSFPLLDEAFKISEAAGVPTPGRQVHNAFNFAHGNLLFITLQPVPEAYPIFKRFASTFEQTYTRFLDLQKAEAQAREAEIELALERIRAKTMAMQHSSELADAAQLLFRQVEELGVDPWTSGFQLWDEGRKSLTVWTSTKGVLLPPFKVPTNDDPLMKHIVDAAEKEESLYVEAMDGEALADHYRFMFSLPTLQEVFGKVAVEGHTVPTFQINHAAYFSYGYLLFITQEPVPAMHDIFKRFAKVFEQTYTRFLDLQKAEAQAREAQIEAALERVRSRSMAMHDSNELGEVAKVMFNQMKLLGGHLFAFGIVLCHRHKNTVEQWHGLGAGDMLTPFQVPVDLDYIHRYRYDQWKAGVELFSIEIPSDYIDRHFELMFELPSVRVLLNDLQSKGIELTHPSWEIDYGASFGHGYLLVSSLQPYKEAKIFPRFAKVFEQAYTRFLDLQKAEAQAREAQIEAALERVRSRSMAMHRSEELSDLSLELVKQVQALGVATWFCAFNIYDEQSNDSIEWGSNGEGVFSKYRTPREGVFLRYYEAGQRGETLHIHEITEDKCPAHYEYLCSLPGVGGQLLQMKEAGIPFPKYQVDHVAFFKQGYLLFITYEPVPETHDIFKRFAKVFEQSYTRFLDLQKAEAQAREAQIEAALEKVRSKSMAMHHSNDLMNVNIELFDQLNNLKLVTESCWISLIDPLANTINAWARHGKQIKNTIVKASDFPNFQTEIDAWKNNVEYIQLSNPTNVFVDGVKTFFGFEVTPPEEAENFYLLQIRHKFGYLGFGNWEQATEEKVSICKRFTGVFEQTYTRFLDLQKAEAQAGEAEIQLALERVRARAMAMHNSHELKEVVHELRKQMGILGQKKLETCVIHLYDESAEYIQSWAGIDPSDSGSEILDATASVPKKGLVIIEEALAAYAANQREYIILNEGDKLKQWFSFLEKASPESYAKLVGSVQGKIEDLRAFWSFADFSGGSLLMVTREKPDEPTRELLRRFSSVFGLGYRRFADLKQAEAQAREARIEAALEKVRSRTLAMQRSDELAETAAVLFRQLISLGIEPNRLYIILTKEDAPDMEAWVTDEDGSRVSKGFTGNYTQNVSLEKMYAGWKEKRTNLVIDMVGDELQQYFQYLHDQLKVPFKGGLEQKRRVQHIAYFSHGLIGMASPDPQPAETLQLMERFAAVFNLTYTRFSDLKIAEAHALQAEQDLMEIKAAKQKAEEALTELQATQKQLIQAEKMASLGELTAGIAHEIQNPLNFVNNFSEVSRELIEELMDEVEKGNMDEVKLLAGDVVQNLEKIHHHGKRADGIVKGMLQHSRSGTGQKELTDINALCDEYLRLAYHGLKARDKSFNAKFEMIADPNLPLVNVMQQELGRVILNLINNAFYAVAEKKRTADADYIPEVKVSTKLVFPPAGGLRGAEISVEDNGNGIPDSIREKIFQPFFTTKPTGQGTGLGLSLSYDIVKAHGGTITLESEPSKFTRFIISLNIND